MVDIRENRNDGQTLYQLGVYESAERNFASLTSPVHFPHQVIGEGK
jgi:hypothetical protein